MGKKLGKMKNPLHELLETNIDFKKWYYKARDQGFYVYAVTGIPNQWSHLNEKEKQKRLRYLHICSPEEIERIISPTNVSDLLLRYRADSIISNMRILRMFEKRASYVKESEWTLKDQFDDSIFGTFHDKIAEKHRKNINDITFGTFFSDDPNGYCIKTKFGPLIILSEALKKFFYFMNLSLHGFRVDVNNKVSQLTQEQALLIGIRTMVLTESFDFEIDPRGEVPEDIDRAVKEMATLEMLFAIAHEYAHFLLNHLDDRNVTSKVMSHLMASKLPLHFERVTIYSQSQVQEFEADNFGIKILSGDDVKKEREILLYAITVMSYFDIFEALIHVILEKASPSDSHPSARERRKRMIKIGRKIWDSDELETCKRLIRIANFFKKRVIIWYTKNPSTFTQYGSIYLDQWKGKPKIDRIDY
jgi:hypothetical protein